MSAYTITIGGSAGRPISQVHDLRAFLADFQRSDDCELFLSRDDGSWSCVLTHGNRAFVALSVEIDRENYFAVDTDYDGPDFSVPFRLSNGQVDEHLRSSTVSVADALASIEDFFLKGARSQRIQWKSMDPVTRLP